MYFVAHLQVLNKHVVVPAAWIKGIDRQFEKFVNLSLNKSQVFLCFYTTHEVAFVDGRPNGSFEPDFSKMVTHINADGSFNGTFHCQLKQYKCKCRHYMMNVKLNMTLIFSH